MFRWAWQPVDHGGPRPSVWLGKAREAHSVQDVRSAVDRGNTGVASTGFGGQGQIVGFRDNGVTGQREGSR